MYDGKFWDEVYKKGFIPWTDKNKDSFSAEKVIQDTGLTQSAKILDYGCGEGILGKYFLAHGLDVDFAEISEIQVKALRKELGDKSTVYQVNEPHDIKQKYDLIICSAVMHHIEPQRWGTFLKQFQNLLKKGGVLWVSGFDEKDKIFEQYQGNAPATGHRCWTINELSEVAQDVGFEISANYAQDIKIDAFDNPRTLHVFCLKPKKEQSKTKEKSPNLVFNRTKDRVEYVSQKLQNLRDDRKNKTEKNIDELSSKQKEMQQALIDNDLSVEDMGKTGEKNGNKSKKNETIAAIQIATYQKILEKKGLKK